MTNRNYHLLSIVLTIAALLSLCSCSPKDNNGFPNKINFSSDGGTEIVKGDNNPNIVYVYEGKDLVDVKGTYSFERDSLVVCEWLTLRRGSSDCEFELTAAPNESYKKRILSLELVFGRTWGLISVTQKGR